MHFRTHSIMILIKIFPACTSQEHSSRNLVGRFLNSVCFASTMDFQSNLFFTQLPTNLNSYYNFTLFKASFIWKLLLNIELNSLRQTPLESIWNSLLLSVLAKNRNKDRNYHKKNSFFCSWRNQHHTSNLKYYQWK